MNATLLTGLAVFAGIGAFVLSRNRAAVSIVPQTAPTLPDPRFPAWRAPDQYRGAIVAAERAQDIPAGLLERQLWQESRYRPDVISGQVISSAGAVGIAQIVPKWHPDVNPLDPLASIHYAARYMRQLRNQFGDWRKALAAYNWGPGNLSRVQLGIASWLSQTPPETRAYVTEITRDVPV